jgi:hypothetical protein
MERGIWDAYREGAQSIPEHTARSPSVRADRLRHLLLTGPAPRPGRQAALRLHAVTVTGGLDLRDAVLSCVIDFDGCTFTDPLALDGLNVPAMWINGCQLPGFTADRLSVTRSLTVTRSRIDGSCYLRDARIGAQLDLEDTTVVPTRYTGERPDPGSAGTPDNYVGIDAENITIGGDLDGKNLTCNGALFLNLARIDGALILRGAHFPGGFIQAPSLVAGGVYLRRMRLAGGINLSYAVVNGPVELTGATIANPGQISFRGWGMTVAGSFNTDTETVFAGTIDLQAADIRGAVQLSHVRCTDPGEHGSLYLPRTVIRGGIVARHVRLAGPVYLDHARVSVGVDMYAAAISAAGAAPGSVHAENIAVTGDLDVI